MFFETCSPKNKWFWNHSSIYKQTRVEACLENLKSCGPHEKKVKCVVFNPSQLPIKCNSLDRKRTFLLNKVHIFWEIWEISTVDLFYVVPVKSTVEISQNFVAFSEYMNFTEILWKNFWSNNWRSDYDVVTWLCY